MRRAAAAALAAMACLTAPAMGQQATTSDNDAVLRGLDEALGGTSDTITTQQLGEIQDQSRTLPAAGGEPVTSGTGAVLRGLDKISGESRDVTIADGDEAQLFGLDVGVADCRYPSDDPAGDAFAYLTIRDAPKSGQDPQPGQDTVPPLFAGWMIASSPALNALQHPRYDVWVLRCSTDKGSESSE